MYITLCSSTCFEHRCAHLQEENCIYIQILVSSHSVTCHTVHWLCPLGWFVTRSWNRSARSQSPYWRPQVASDNSWPAHVPSNLPHWRFSCRVNLEYDMFGENGREKGEMNFIYTGLGPVMNPPSHINVTDHIPYTLLLSIIYTYHFPNFYIELSDVHTRARVRRNVFRQKILQPQQNKKQWNVLYVSSRNQGVVMYHGIAISLHIVKDHLNVS